MEKLTFELKTARRAGGLRQMAIIGVVGTAIAALADPLGIGEGETFGWLQLTGVILGGIVILLGVVIATGWVAYPGRPARDDTLVARHRRDCAQAAARWRNAHAESHALPA